MNKIENGKTVSVHYVGTFDDGSEFDSSRQRGEPVNFELGQPGLIPGFASAVSEMEIGETKNVTIPPAEAFGMPNPEAFQVVPREAFPDDFEFEVGGLVMANKGPDVKFPARIHALQEQNVTLDFNHPMAGKNLNFEIELLDIK